MTADTCLTVGVFVHIDTGVIFIGEFSDAHKITDTV